MNHEADPHLALIGTRVRMMRVEKGLTQLEASKLLAISKAGLWQIEHGYNAMGIDIACRVCLAFDVSPNFLLFGKDKYEHEQETQADPGAERAPAAASQR